MLLISYNCFIPLAVWYFSAYRQPVLLLVHICVVSRLGLLWACYEHSCSCALEHAMPFSKIYPLEGKCYIIGFNVTIWCWTIFQTCTNLCSYLHCVNVSLALHPDHHLTLRYFLALLICVLPHHGCNLHFLITKDVEFIFMFIALLVAHFLICLFKSFEDFYVRLSFFPY